MKSEDIEDIDNIQPQGTNLPDVSIGNEFRLEFSSDSMIKVVPLFNIEEQNIKIVDGIVSGVYSAIGGVNIKTVKDSVKYNFTKFSEIPEGHLVYHFITNSNTRFEFKYRVTSNQDEKIYTQYANSDWTTLSSEFRRIKWRD